MKMLPPDMVEATRLTRAGKLSEATTLIQSLLGGRRPAAADPNKRDHSTGETALVLPSPAVLPMAAKVRNFFKAGASALSPKARIEPPEGARFVTASFANEAGRRDYKLFIPKGYCGKPLPLIVMLHGCTQSPDDFAAGTRMNALGEKHSIFVAYPSQPKSANISKCWNWFKRGDQQRDRGEPSLIAGITRQIATDYAIDERRIYVAGLSAGGAAAAIMGSAYPDLYAAVGVHSGLPCGAAGDMASAFSAMQQGSQRVASQSAEFSRLAPTIVFHGDKDTTVNPKNGTLLIEQLRLQEATNLRSFSKQGKIKDGHSYSRTNHLDADGRAILEMWIVHGADHAWSGGSPAGSFTDPRGPDASREMVRFFLEHVHPA